MKHWRRAWLVLGLIALQPILAASPATAVRPDAASAASSAAIAHPRAVPDLLRALSDALQAACGPSECYVDGINNRVVNAVLRDHATTLQALAKVDYLRQDGKSVSNLAAALASCTDCRSIAVAVQAVIVPAKVTQIDQLLSNTVSLALDCTACTTAAYSHVLVVASDQDNPRLSPTAVAKVKSVQVALSLLDRSQPSDQLFAQIDALVSQFDDAVLNGFGSSPRWARMKTDHRAS
jgi:hypothetical protein